MSGCTFSGFAVHGYCGFMIVGPHVQQDRSKCHQRTVLSTSHLSESRFLLGALHGRNKFANFCHD